MIWYLSIIIMMAFLIVPISSSRAIALDLARNSITKYVIVVADDAIDAENTAAKELQYYLGKVTGAEFSVYRESNAPEKSPQILVGQCRRLAELIPKVDLSALGNDGIVIKTVGNTLVLAGGRPRGTLYAVYTFLEDAAGCRWWTSTEDFIPSKPDFNIPSLNTTYKPPFKYRETFYADVRNNTLFAAKLKLNGSHHMIAPEYGGHLNIIGWCHTFYKYLPPDKYFSEHPEWYSEIGGKRTHSYAQLCLTNDNMRKEMTRVVIEQISQNPNAGIISVSQNDSFGRCECTKCKALEENEGSPSGPLLHFVNEIAAEVEKKYPNVSVETLAYQYTRKPPLHVKPRHNVIIRLCTIECSFIHPLDNPINKSFQDDINAWQALTKNLFVWDYVANFSSFLNPNPNLRVLGPNVRYFAKNHVIGLFEQGDGYSNIGDFIRMRAWVISHLLWDSSRDANKLQMEFLKGYYGPAAPHISNYLNVVCDAAENKKRYIGCFDQDPAFMKLDEMNKATMLLDKAEEAVAGDAILAERVKRDRLTLDHLWLLRGYFLKFQAEQLGKPYKGPKDISEAGEKFLDLAHKFKAGHQNEGQTFDAYETSLKELFHAKAITNDKCKLFSDTSRIEIQDGMFRVDNEHRLSQIVDDPLASDGKTIFMPGTHKEWATQFAITQDMVDMLPVKVHCYVVARCEAETTNGAAFSCGIWDLTNAVNAGNNNAQIEAACDGNYHAYDLGIHELKSGYMFWAAPPGKDLGLKAVYVDCIVLVPAK